MAFNHRSIQNPSTNHRGIFKKCSFQSNQHPQLGLCVPRSNYQAVCFALLQNASCGRGDRLVGRWIATANMSLSICSLVHEIPALDAGCFEKLHFSNITWQWSLGFWMDLWLNIWHQKRPVVTFSIKFSFKKSSFCISLLVSSLQSAVCSPQFAFYTDLIGCLGWLTSLQKLRPGKMKNKNLTKSLGL